MIEHGKTTNLRADLLEAKTRIVDLSQLVREQQREITALKKRLLDSQARTKELYLALREVVTKNHPALRRKR